MAESEVFFTDLRADVKTNPLKKISVMLDRLEVKRRVKKNHLVALKIHFGERGSTAFVRPVFVREIVDKVRALKAKPFLTDTNTLYVGSRGESASHFVNAMENGFLFPAAGAPVIIGGGIRGNRCVSVKVGLAHYEEVELAPEIVDADAIIGVTHFKCHEMSGIGGVLKNFGMGCASRQGKLSMHSTASPFVKEDACVGCGRCLSWCAYGAITLERRAKGKEGPKGKGGKKKSRIEADSCTGCGACLPTCPEGAIRVIWDQGIGEMQEKMVEYAYGAIHAKGEQALFVNFLLNITPLCDCYPFSDAPIVPDIGILASADPVALDQASADLVNAQRGLSSSALKKNHAEGEDKFRGVAPEIDWTLQLRYAEEIGLGNRSYRLEKV